MKSAPIATVLKFRRCLVDSMVDGGEDVTIAGGISKPLCRSCFACSIMLALYGLTE